MKTIIVGLLILIAVSCTGKVVKQPRSTLPWERAGLTEKYGKACTNGTEWAKWIFTWPDVPSEEDGPAYGYIFSHKYDGVNSLAAILSVKNSEGYVVPAVIGVSYGDDKTKAEILLMDYYVLKASQEEKLSELEAMSRATGKYFCLFQKLD